MSLVDATGRPITGSSVQPVITIVLEGRTLNFGANTQLINKLPNESRRKILEIVTTLLLHSALLFLSFGCAGRQTPHHDPAPQGKFWRGCNEVIPAKPDGYQHFLCQDVKDRRWEVLVKREGK